VVEPSQEQGQQGEGVVNFTIIDCEQRSPEWYAARAGRLTGSAAPDMMRTQKSGQPSASRKHLITRLALERITGRPQEREFTTAAVQHGIDMEPAAFGRYEAETGEILERVGFLSLGGVMAGCSLDAFVCGRRGIIEGKAPESATHLEYLQTRKIPDDYRWQCIHNLWVSGADYCDFISFDDRFPDELQYLCVRLERNEQEIQAYAAAAGRLLAEVSVAVNEINKLKAAA
jgi:predicted phage-related endonuclease